jgi:hypothetical protein
LLALLVVSFVFVLAVGLVVLAVRVVLALTFFLLYMLSSGLFAFEGKHHYLIHYEDLLSKSQSLMRVLPFALLYEIYIFIQTNFFLKSIYIFNLKMI